MISCSLWATNSGLPVPGDVKQLVQQCLGVRNGAVIRGYRVGASALLADPSTLPLCALSAWRVLPDDMETVPGSWAVLTWSILLWL